MKFRSVELIPGQRVTLADGRILKLDRVVRPYPHCPPAEIKMVCGRHRIPITQLADYGPDVALSWRQTDAQIVRLLQANRRARPPLSDHFIEGPPGGARRFVTLAPNGRALVRYTETEWHALGRGQGR